MKLLLLPLLLAGVGAGWFGLNAASAGDDLPSCPTENCRVTVECTERGSCLVTCYDENDQIVCQEEVPCDGPCDKACETPCDSGAATAKPCTPGPGCKR